LWTYASAEAQVAALSDDIAYDAHDIDDGLRADLFTLEDIAEVPLIGNILSQIDAQHPSIEAARRAHEVVRALITRMIEDVIGETGRRAAMLKPCSAACGLFTRDGKGRPGDQGLSLPAHVSS